MGTKKRVDWRNVTHSLLSICVTTFNTARSNKIDGAAKFIGSFLSKSSTSPRFTSHSSMARSNEMGRICGQIQAVGNLSNGYVTNGYGGIIRDTSGPDTSIFVLSTFPYIIEFSNTNFFLYITVHLFITYFCLFSFLRRRNIFVIRWVWVFISN